MTERERQAVANIGKGVLRDLAAMRRDMVSPLVDSGMGKGASDAMGCMDELVDVAGLITRKGKILWLFPSRKRTGSALADSMERLERACAGLEKAARGLREDDRILASDRERFEELCLRLDQAVSDAKAVLAQDGLDEDLSGEARARVMSLQEARVVAGQGVAAMETIRQNNLILSRGIESALAVTGPAVAMAGVISAGNQPSGSPIAIVRRIADSAGATLSGIEPAKAE